MVTVAATMVTPVFLWDCFHRFSRRRIKSAGKTNSPTNAPPTVKRGLIGASAKEPAIAPQRRDTLVKIIRSRLGTRSSYDKRWWMGTNWTDSRCDVK